MRVQIDCWVNKNILIDDCYFHVDVYSLSHIQTFVYDALLIWILILIWIARCDAGLYDRESLIG